MDSMNTQLEVLEICSAPPRPCTSWSTVVPSRGHSSVVLADGGAEIQGTGMPFAGVVDATPSERHYGPSGTTSWSPPV